MGKRIKKSRMDYLEIGACIGNPLKGLSKFFKRKKKSIKKDKQFSSIEEVKDYLNNMKKDWTILDYLESYWYRYFWNYVSSIPLKIKSFIQRGKRGWADEDTWDFDDYLTDIIIGGMSHLKKYIHGYPYTKKVRSLREWKRILQKIIKGFKAYKKACDYTKTNTKEKFDKQMKKFNEGMKLFVKYYGAFWD